MDIHEVIDRTQGGGAVLADPPTPALQSPVRNRYFYGKLLDEYHLELEQSYFLDARRLLNRLTVGFGVVCGLGVSVTANGLVIAPGVAIDGLGREIVVPTPIRVADPTQLTDDCGKPGGKATLPEVTLCLAYHECETEPVPVLISDCDVREGCAAGAIRERYKLLVHDGVPGALPYRDEVGLACALLKARLPGTGNLGSLSNVRRMLLDVGLQDYGGVSVAAGGGRGIDTGYGRVGEVAPRDVLGCEPPAETCVVLATVTLGDGDTIPLSVDNFTYRRIVFSNDRLFEALLCLARELAGGTQAENTIAAKVDGGDGDKLRTVTATVTDAAGAAVKGALVEFDTTSSFSSVFQPTAGRTDENGTATVSWKLGVKGDHTAVAHIDGGAAADLNATLNG
ncbi:MAG TPA: Ig-like domain-containing protein [Gaiellaceae bacterium]